MELDKDVFSSGQIRSKLWLCEQLELLDWKSELTYIYGGWQGILAFLILSRNNNIKTIRSFDIDHKCEEIADLVNENWVINNWRFKAFTKDCNTINPTADLIINTATEHFKQDHWFHNIPKGTRIILQSNNMKLDSHHNIVESLEDFKQKFPLTEIVFADKINFKYPTWYFDRYMMIGIK